MVGGFSKDLNLLKKHFFDVYDDPSLKHAIIPIKEKPTQFAPKLIDIINI